LLSCLEVSYNTAVEFDSRPGLKFLIQKVAELDRAANLYRQAGAAWTINLIALFDLCLHKVDSDMSENKDMKEFTTRLRQSLEQLCDTYVDVLLDKDGLHSAVDMIDAKITFIIAQTDELPDLDSEPVSKHDETSSIPEEDKQETGTEDNISCSELESPKEKEIEKGSFIAEIEKQKDDSICKVSINKLIVNFP
jgi:brefeldin A-inhibited guanine nucleotide-exchange protein 3